LRNGAFGFADAETELARVNRLPDPVHSFRSFLRDGGGEFAHHVFFEVGPEFEERHGAIEANIERFVIGIVVALHEGVDRRGLRIGADRAAPEGAEIGENV
jgi:hypothetical protein